jgi:cardiolipin synthase
LKKHLTLPNILSALRLLIFPFLLYYAFMGERNIFAWLFLISLVTDIADGFIARRFNMITAFGSRLDSLGDLCNAIAALYGIISLCRSDVEEHYIGFIVLFSLFFLGYIIMFIKFKRLIGMHLYIAKITAYVQGVFLITWFMFGFNDMLFYIAMTVGMYSFTEEIILLLLLKKPDHDLKSLYWVILHRKELWRRE